MMKMFDKMDVLKVAGIATTVVGIGLTIANDFLAEKNLDDKIGRKVSEALTKIDFMKDSKSEES